MVYDKALNIFKTVTIAEVELFKDRYDAEAVLVIPKSHTSDGKARYVSLVTMSVLTPESGSVATSESTSGTDITMYWGGYGKDLSGLTNYTTVAAYPSIPLDDASVATRDYAYIPSTSFSSGNIASLDGVSYYYSNTLTERFAPSPYLVDGSVNQIYRTAGQGFCDMDGSGNTNVIIATCDPSELVSGGTVTNSSGLVGSYESHAPAVTCHRYHTDHSNAGDWYLPSAGEAGYLISRLKEIDATLTALKGLGYRAVNVTNSVWLWTSTEYSANHARYVGTGSGDCSIDGKSNLSTLYRVRAFRAY